MSSKKPLVLVDGSSYLFRAFHALPPLTNSKGSPTGAVYGVVNMLKKLVRDVEPEHIAVVFDPKGKTFRHEMYPEYKANRAVMPDDLRVQIEPLHTLIKALGFPLIVMEGVEADDVIGTLAHLAKKKGMPVLISTGDKDMAQLVNQHVTLINTMSNKTLDPEGVVEKFGVPPERIIDYLALMGDTSDNVPGVPKVGPKTAAKWLKEYGSLDAIIENADHIKGKVGENLRASLEHLQLARELVTIKLDVDLEITPETLISDAPDTKALHALFQDLEFKSWLRELEAGAPESVEKKEVQYEAVFTQKALEAWIKKLNAADCFSFDTETTSLDSMRAELVGVSFSVKAGEAAYVPIAHDYMDAPAQLDKQTVLDALTTVLGDPKKTVVGQNLKYDIQVLKNCGVEIKAAMFDTMLESYVLNSTSVRHDMDTLALKHLGESTIKFEDVAGKGAKQITFNAVSLDAAVPYACEDADITLQLHHVLYPQIQAETAYQKVFSDIEMLLMPILAQMEYDGVLIDADMLKKQSAVLQKRIESIQEKVFKLAEYEFNLSSPKQLIEILYDKMQLPILKKTPKGQPSTAEAVLQELAHDYPLPKHILEFRSLSKIKSTYTDALPLQINPKTGRVHTSYNQAVTSTGRLSSRNPNLQNIPIRTEEGRKIRQAFIAPEKHVLLAADYSQVELRIMAHFSKDPGLVAAFEQGLDVHASTAAEVFGVALEDVTPDQRRSAKAINFGLIYGMSSFGLSQQLGISRQDAQQHMDVYFERYPAVHGYMESARADAEKQGYVETLFGHRLYVPDINATNQQRKKAAERAAINAPLQGTAADIIKLAMIAIDQWIAQSGLDVTMIMQVHDELIFDIAENDLDKAKKEIKALMENTVRLSVPLVVDVGVGSNWDEAH